MTLLLLGHPTPRKSVIATLLYIIIDLNLIIYNWKGPVGSSTDSNGLTTTSYDKVNFITKDNS